MGARGEASAASDGDNEWATLVELLLVEMTTVGYPAPDPNRGIAGAGAGARIYLEEEAPIVESSKGPTEAIDEMEWTVAMGGSGDGSFDRLGEDPQFQQNLLADLSSLTGDDAATVRLDRGSIVAHIVSPAVNFRRARARFMRGEEREEEEKKHRGELEVEEDEEEEPRHLQCGGMEVTGVELGDWLIVDRNHGHS